MTEGGEPALGCSAELCPLVAHPSTQLVIRGCGVEWGTRPGAAGAGETGQSPPGRRFRRGDASLEDSSKLFHGQAGGAGRSQARGRRGPRTRVSRFLGFPLVTGRTRAATCPHPPSPSPGGSGRSRSFACSERRPGPGRRLASQAVAQQADVAVPRSPDVCAGSVPSKGTVRRLASQITDRLWP